MKRYPVLFFAMVFISFLLLTAVATAMAAESLASVTETKGKAFAVRADGTKVELKNGDQIFVGDRVNTEANSTVDLLFTDGEVRTITSESEVKFANRENNTNLSTGDKISNTVSHVTSTGSTGEGNSQAVTGIKVNVSETGKSNAAQDASAAPRTEAPGAAPVESAAVSAKADSGGAISGGDNDSRSLNASDAAERSVDKGEVVKGDMIVKKPASQASIPPASVAAEKTPPAPVQPAAEKTVPAIPPAIEKTVPAGVKNTTDAAETAVPAKKESVNDSSASQTKPVFEKPSRPALNESSGTEPGGATNKSDTNSLPKPDFGKPPAEKPTFDRPFIDAPDKPEFDPPGTRKPAFKETENNATGSQDQTSSVKPTFGRPVLDRPDADVPAFSLPEKVTSTKKEFDIATSDKTTSDKTASTRTGDKTTIDNSEKTTIYDRPAYNRPEIARPIDRALGTIPASSTTVFTSDHPDYYNYKRPEMGILDTFEIDSKSQFVKPGELPPLPPDALEDNRLVKPVQNIAGRPGFLQTNENDQTDAKTKRPVFNSFDTGEGTLTDKTVVPPYDRVADQRYRPGYITGTNNVDSAFTGEAKILEKPPLKRPEYERDETGKTVVNTGVPPSIFRPGRNLPPLPGEVVNDDQKTNVQKPSNLERPGFLSQKTDSSETGVIRNVNKPVDFLPPVPPQSRDSSEVNVKVNERTIIMSNDKQVRPTLPVNDPGTVVVPAGTTTTTVKPGVIPVTNKIIDTKRILKGNTNPTNTGF